MLENITIEKDFKKGLKEKDPKIWLILGAVLIAVALMAKILLIAGLVIIGVVGYYWYVNQQNKEKLIRKDG